MEKVEGRAKMYDEKGREGIELRLLEILRKKFCGGGAYVV